MPPGAGDEAGQLGATFSAMARGLVERERLRTLFGRAVDPRVRDELHAVERRGGELREATVVFVDLVGFTSLAGALEPSEVVLLLNCHFEAVPTRWARKTSSSVPPTGSNTQW